MQPDETILLYHASPHIGDNATHLLPRPQHTCVWQEFKDTPEQKNHEGDFVFAGTNKRAAYAYSLKLEHPDEMEHQTEGDPRKYQFMASVDVVKAGDKEIVSTIITRPAEFLKALKATKPKILAFPPKSDSYTFNQVHKKNGMPAGEYVSKTAIPLSECSVTPVEGLGQVMREGVQVLFLNEGISKRQWFQMGKEANIVFNASLPESIKNDPTAYGAAMYQANLEFMAKMVESGVLIHANRECGIEAVDYRTGQALPPEAVKIPVAGSWQQMALQQIFAQMSAKNAL